MLRYRPERASSEFNHCSELAAVFRTAEGPCSVENGVGLEYGRSCLSPIALDSDFSARPGVLRCRSPSRTVNEVALAMSINEATRL